MKQFLDGIDHDSKNYQGLCLCLCLPQPWCSTDNIFGLVNSRYHSQPHPITEIKLWILDKSVRACSAFFTFVSLDEKRRPQAIPSLELNTDEERKRFETGRKRYLRRKERRASH